MNLQFVQISETESSVRGEIAFVFTKKKKIWSRSSAWQRKR